MFSYVYLKLPVRTPDLVVRRAGMLDKVVQAAGLGDVEFANEEFGRAFSVKCADAWFAQEVMTPEMMTYLLEQGPEKLELRGGSLFFIDGRGEWSPAEFDRVLTLAQGFLERWPATAFSFAGRPDSART